MMSPTESNVKTVLRAFEDGVTLAERTQFKRRAKAILFAGFGCAILLSCDLSAICLFAADISLDISLSDPNVLASCILVMVLLLILFCVLYNILSGPPIGSDGPAEGGGEWSRQIVQAYKDKVAAESQRRASRLLESEDGAAVTLGASGGGTAEGEGSSDRDDVLAGGVLAHAESVDVGAASPLRGAGNRVHPGSALATNE